MTVQLGAGRRRTAHAVFLVTAAAATAAAVGTARAEDALPAGGSTAGEDAPSALREAVEGALGAPVHGRLSFRAEGRFRGGHAGDGYDSVHDDFDLYSYLDLRVGDEQRDPLSATFYVRSAWDIGEQRKDGEYFSSLQDTRGQELTADLFTAYVTWRPKDGRFESVRAGRQFLYVADTFQFDGATATTKPLVKEWNLKVQGYGGVPVHLYESSSSGDWLAGVRVTADPRKGTRTALDYTHVQDEISGYGTNRTDLAALSAWQAVGENTELYGRYTWLEGPRDVTVRGTVSFPEKDLMLQASYKRLLSDQDELATEFDPYYSELRTLREYHLFEGRAVKGFGKWQIEGGASARVLVHGGDEGVYNRETKRGWLTPSVDDLLWDGSTLSVTGELWDGGGSERIQTWAADLTHHFGKSARLSVGTDYSLWDYGSVQDGERSHLRTAYVRLNAKLSDTWTLDMRYAWQRDDEETDHVVSLGLSVDF